jgi:hypothetical protein
MRNWYIVLRGYVGKPLAHKAKRGRTHSQPERRLVMLRFDVARVLGVAAGCMAIAAAAATAGPVATGSQVREFLGASGTLVYTKLDCNDNSCNKAGRSLWYVDFSEETLVERQVVDYHTANTEPRNEIISPDGQWVTYNTRQSGNTLYACRLQENSPTPISLGTGALPVWWTKPGTSELYIIYVDRDLENGGWAATTGDFPRRRPARRAVCA